jgi:hypothetical protein
MAIALGVGSMLGAGIFALLVAEGLMQRLHGRRIVAQHL